MTSKIRKCLFSSTNCSSSLTTSRPSVQSNQKHGFNYVSKLIIIINVILLHCIVGNLCASWQENVRPKLFVQLGKCLLFKAVIKYSSIKPRTQTFSVLIFLSLSSLYVETFLHQNLSSTYSSSLSRLTI